MTVEVEFFDDIEDLEGHLEKHDLYGGLTFCVGKEIF